MAAYHELNKDDTKVVLTWDGKAQKASPSTKTSDNQRVLRAEEISLLQGRTYQMVTNSNLENMYMQGPLYRLGTYLFRCECPRLRG